MGIIIILILKLKILSLRKVYYSLKITHLLSGQAKFQTQLSPSTKSFYFSASQFEKKIPAYTKANGMNLVYLRASS